MRNLVEAYRERTDDVPRTLAGIFPGERGPGSLAIDAWGTPIRFYRDAGRYALISAGPDGVFETDDDIFVDHETEMPTHYPRPDRTLVLLRHLQLRATVFHARAGEYPRDLDDLRNAGLGTYLGIEDEWGRAVLYSRTQGSFEVRSAGADGEFNTSDDLVVQGPFPLFSTP